MHDTARQPQVAGPELSDLLARAAAGDQAAWRCVVDLYAGRVFALAKSRVRRADLAEDITQSVMVTVASKLGAQAAGGYTEQGRFEAWLFRVAINRVRDEIRRLRRNTDTSLDGERAPEVPAASPPTTSGFAELLPALRRAMATLGDADREVLELRHHGNLGFAQIAETLEEPLGTVLARHHRALRKLKSLLSAEGAAPDDPETAS